MRRATGNLNGAAEPWPDAEQTLHQRNSVRFLPTLARAEAEGCRVGGRQGNPSRLLQCVRHIPVDSHVPPSEASRLAAALQHAAAARRLIPADAHSFIHSHFNMHFRILIKI